MKERPDNLTISEKDIFGVSRERREETDSLKVDLLLLRCRRKGIQPREMLLKFLDPRPLKEIYGSEFVEKLKSDIENLPEYDLLDEKDLIRAKADTEAIYGTVSDLEYKDDKQAERLKELEEGKRSHWQEAGLFSYEIDSNNHLNIHIPPTEKAPAPSEFKEAIAKIIEVLKANESIKEIRASSILLEHPAVQRIGFNIDLESDEGNLPNFRMAREEFINKFEK